MQDDAVDPDNSDPPQRQEAGEAESESVSEPQTGDAAPPVLEPRAGQPLPAVPEPRVEDERLEAVLTPITGRAVGIAEKQEVTRSLLAAALLGLIAAIVLTTLVAIAFAGVEWEQLEAALTLMFGPIITALATVLGFYFGEQQQG